MHVTQLHETHVRNVCYRVACDIPRPATALGPQRNTGKMPCLSIHQYGWKLAMRWSLAVVLSCYPQTAAATQTPAIVGIKGSVFYLPLQKKTHLT